MPRERETHWRTRSRRWPTWSRTSYWTSSRCSGRSAGLSSGSNVPTEVGEVVTSAPEVEAGNRFSVEVRDGGDGRGIGQGIGQGIGWSVAILDPEGREVAV